MAKQAFGAKLLMRKGEIAVNAVRAGELQVGIE
jgi:hypothetical protein